MTVAQTIACQLGRTTFSLLGAECAVDIGDGLQFRIKGCLTANLVQIILDPYDTYTVKFCKLEAVERKNRGLRYTEMTWRVISSHRDIYWDMLHDLIEEQTGLSTRAAG